MGNSDAMNRYRMMFTIGALEDMIFDNALDGVPSLISHDFHRPIGWHTPFGLYFEPKLTRVVGEYLLPENDKEEQVIYKAHHAAFSKRDEDHCQSHLAEFEGHIENFLTDEAGYFFNGCVLYQDQDIITRIYPELVNRQDKDGLIFVSDVLKSFEYLGQGVFKEKNGSLAIFCHQFFRRNLSRRNNFYFYFLDDFICNNNPDITLRIALDSDLIGYAPSFNIQMELEYWWGPNYSDDIENIPGGVTVHKCSDRQKLFSGISETQFWWKKSHEEKILEAEELRDRPVLGVGKDSYGCRYVHSIYKNGVFSHFDGAIRMYGTEKMTERLENPINKAGKNAEYTKLFRIDGKLELSKWKTYVTNYFQDNPLFYEYFGLKTQYEELLKGIEPKDERPIQEKLVPYLMRAEDGVRIFVSYHSPSDPISVDRKFINLDHVLLENGDRKPSMELMLSKL